MMMDGMNERAGKEGVSIDELIAKNKLHNLTPHLDTKNRYITIPDINRPALQLTGFFAHFDKDRVQIIGYVEQEYINQMTKENRRAEYEKLLSYDVPCILYSRVKQH